MNHLTVAQNIFIGREPRGASACSSTKTALNAQARDNLRAHAPEARPAHAGRRR